jgi:hypothetical protein
MKGIYEIDEGYVVKIRRRGHNYSKVFKFHTPTNKLKTLPSDLDKAKSKRKALNEAMEWQEKELNSILGQGVKSSQNADYLTLRDVLDGYKAEAIPLHKAQKKEEEVWGRAVERAKALLDKPIFNISDDQWEIIRDKAVKDGYPLVNRYSPLVRHSPRLLTCPQNEALRVLEILD